jgi:hypothetical protein
MTNRFLFLIVLMFPLTTWCAPKDSKVDREIDCEITITNGKSTQVFHGRSKTRVEIKVGDYTLHSEIANQGKNYFLISPHFNVNVFKGDPIRNSIFRASLGGFGGNTLKEPLTLTGFQFIDFLYNQEKFTRMDYICSLEY